MVRMCAGVIFQVSHVSYTHRSRSRSWGVRQMRTSDERVDRVRREIESKKTTSGGSAEITFTSSTFVLHSH